MANTRSSLPTHRARMERKDFVRVEVNVRKDDAGLVRSVAGAALQASA